MKRALSDNRMVGGLNRAVRGGIFQDYADNLSMSLEVSSGIGVLENRNFPKIPAKRIKMSKKEESIAEEETMFTYFS